MFCSEIKAMALSAFNKVELMRLNPIGYFLLSMLAGVYVGLGIVLIFSIAGPLQAFGMGAWLKLVMGVSFGIALSLVVFAGAELFTGNNMVGVIGKLSGTITWGQLLRLFLVCYLGNLCGSLLLAGLMIQGGSFSEASRYFILQVSSMKMNLGASELIIRGILCNWLVCLALWISGRTQSDTAKLIVIFWCLFAFIASGFEHCVANMTLLSLALWVPHTNEISLLGMVNNLGWVTLGNFLGGAVFVAMPYWWVAHKKFRESESKVTAEIKTVDLKFLNREERV
jgi:nitrite transporter NirC